MLVRALVAQMSAAGRGDAQMSAAASGDAGPNHPIDEAGEVKRREYARDSWGSFSGLLSPSRLSYDDISVH
jgi:hypothetical protein